MRCSTRLSPVRSVATASGEAVAFGHKYSKPHGESEKELRFQSVRGRTVLALCNNVEPNCSVAVKFSACSPDGLLLAVPWPIDTSNGSHSSNRLLALVPKDEDHDHHESGGIAEFEG